MTAPAVAVRERPILMSGPMVRAILDGRKTQTRRVVTRRGRDEGESYTATPGAGFTEAIIRRDFPCPYGQSGGRLWVRETWASHPDADEGVLYRATDPAWDDEETGLRWRPSIHMPRWASRLTLELTDVRVERVQDISEADANAEGARRFDDIPDPHPFGQGARWSMGNPASTDECLGTPRFAFASTWNALNAKRGYGWDANPWVWVLTFRRVA